MGGFTSGYLTLPKAKWQAAFLWEKKNAIFSKSSALSLSKGRRQEWVLCIYMCIHLSSPRNRCYILPFLKLVIRLLRSVNRRVSGSAAFRCPYGSRKKVHSEFLTQHHICTETVCMRLFLLKLYVPVNVYSPSPVSWDSCEFTLAIHGDILLIQMEAFSSLLD